MTVCVAIKVHDCIVFAADSAVSMTTATQDGGFVVSNVWKHGLKVFNLHRDLPIVAMTAGLGNFGAMSISNLAKDLRIGLMGQLCRDNYTLEEVANCAKLYFEAEYIKAHASPIPHNSFEFWIGGYSHDNQHGEIWKIESHDGDWHNPTQLVLPGTSSQVLWGGQIQAISRLLLGFDPQLNQIVSILTEDQRQLLDSELQKIQTPLVNASMPVQDAIDLADFLVDLTKRYVAFLPGADTVGGDTDIATVTKHEGFKWIRRKHYYPSHLNRRETGHVE